MYDLIDNDADEVTLASDWNFKFKDAMVHKAPYTRKWLMYMDAYMGDYFKNAALPDYKSDLVSNYIFSVVETIRPIMLDNNPKFLSMPRQPEGMKFANDQQEAFMYEWDREDMSAKLYKELVNTLVLGTSVWFIPWDSDEKQIKGIPVNIYNIFPDPLATSFDDAEYIIYASYRNVNKLKKMFPTKAKKLTGGQINYTELVQDNSRNARIDNQVLVLEVWTRDYDTYEEVSEKEKTVKLKYPHGRVITLCPELGTVLSDKANPYNDGEFPFEMIKDYDLPGKFWGEGEVAQLLSPQKYLNQMNNAILDNAKSTANMPWIIDKNSGVKIGGITARPGLVIRKNPGSEVKRDQPPSMPNYVINAVETYKADIEQISGVYSSLKGENSTGVYTAQGILALKESGQVRIRLKVKLMEDSLGKIAMKWNSRMKQFWKEDRWIMITRQDGSYDMKNFTKNVLKYDYDTKVSSGSTMPVNRGAMLDLMIRLAQTQMPDGQPLVDREAVVEYLPEEIKGALLRRMGDKQQIVEQQLQEMQQALEQLGQQLQQFAKQDQQDDKATLSTLDQLTSAIESINAKIIQLQEEYDTMQQEKKKMEETEKIKTMSYNQGYTDSEKLYDPSQQSNPMMGQEKTQVGGLDSLPDDLLKGINGMNDEEFKLLMSQNPQLMDLIK